MLMSPEAGGAIGKLILLNVVFALLGLLVLVAKCKVYMKAGRGWWEAIIPIYNLFILFKIIKIGAANFLWLFVPIANIIMAIKWLHKLSKKFGYGGGFTTGLFFLPFIFFPILAWGDSKYEA